MTQIGNRNKARGTRAERIVGAALERDGYVVARVAGSFGPADLIAMKIGQLLFVQVKTEPEDGRRPAIGPAEWNTLYATALRCGALPIIAIKGFRTLTYRLVTGRKDRRARHPPWTPWQPDLVAEEDNR